MLALLPHLTRLSVPVIALTGNPASPLARAATVNLDVSVAAEACPLNLAPTASTTASLAMGDALAVALLDARGFTADDFARSHPAGALGRRLLLHIADVMHVGDDVPRVAADATFGAVLLEMSRKRLGMTAVVDDDGHLLGRVVLPDAEVPRYVDATHLITLGRDELDVESVRVYKLPPSLVEGH